MSFLWMQGLVFDVEAESDERDQQFNGSVVTTARGNVADARRNLRRRWRFRTTNLENDEARAFVLLAFGVGHVFDFTGAISGSSGLGPRAGYAAHLDIGGGWVRDALVVREGESIVFPAQVANEWTTLLRFRDVRETGSPWRVFGATFDRLWWLDGVQQNGVSPTQIIFADSSTGDVTLFGSDLDGNIADLYVGELVILPWRLTDEMMEEATASETAWGQAPEVLIDGDMVEQVMGLFVLGQGPSGEQRTRARGAQHRGVFQSPGPVGAPFVIDDSFLANAEADGIEMVEVGAPEGVADLPRPTMYAPLSERFHGAVFNELIIGAGGVDPLVDDRTFIAGPDGGADRGAVFTGDAVDDLIPFAPLFGSATGPDGKVSAVLWTRPASLAASNVLVSKWNEGADSRQLLVRQSATGQVVVEMAPRDTFRLSDDTRLLLLCDEASAGDAMTDDAGGGAFTDNGTVGVAAPLLLVTPGTAPSVGSRTFDGATQWQQRAAVAGDRDTFLGAGWTVSARVRLDSVASDRFIFCFTGGGETEAGNTLGSLLVASGKARVFWENGAGVNVTATGASTLSVGVTYVLTAVVDDDPGNPGQRRARIWVNDLLDADVDNLDPATGGTAGDVVWGIGARVETVVSSFFDGDIDGVIVEARAWDSDDVLENVSLSRQTIRPVLEVDAWAHVAVAYEAAKDRDRRARIIVNGNPELTEDLPLAAALADVRFAGLTDESATVCLGVEDPATGEDGACAHLALWDAALSTVQARVAYLATKRGALLRRT